MGCPSFLPGAPPVIISNCGVRPTWNGRSEEVQKKQITWKGSAHKQEQIPKNVFLCNEIMKIMIQFFTEKRTESEFAPSDWLVRCSRI